MIRKWIVILTLLVPPIGYPLNAQTTPPAAEVNTQQDDLQRFRHIIATPTNDLTSRRLMANELVRDDLPERLNLIAELLSQPHDTGTPGVLAYAIADVGAQDRSRLDEGMIEPLLQLLASDNADLRKQASGALAIFPVADVAPRLSALANDSSRPIVQRHEAIDTLSIKVTKREVVGELIKLLRSDTPSVIQRALQALKDASREDYGSDIDGWDAWWQRKLNLSEAEWLRDRLDLVERRSRKLRDEIRQLNDDRTREARIRFQLSGDFMAKVFQLTQDSKREALTIEWLAHSVPDVRIHTLDMIRKQITEGNIPSEAVHAAVSQCLSHPNAKVRTTALEVVGTMKNPNDASLVLSLLNGETDQQLRATILRTLGRLENPVAIDALIAELNHPNAIRECVLEAARAIGVVGARGRVDTAVITPAIEPLRRHFTSAQTDDIPFKETFLLAMANIGAPETTTEFVTHLASESTELVLAAIRGIIVSQSAANIDRVADRLAHPDPRVRQLAVDAVGELGEKPEHLRALMSRLNPDEEPNESIRSAAFQSFRKALNRQPSAEKLDWVEKLTGQSDHQVTILNDYLTEWGTNGAGPELVNKARTLLKDILLAANRQSEAADVLQKMYDASLANERNGLFEIGIELLQLRLDLKQYEKSAELLISLAPQTDDSQKEQIRALLQKHASNVVDNKAKTSFTTQLSALPPDLLGSNWQSFLSSESEKSASTESPIPNGKE